MGHGPSPCIQLSPSPFPSPSHLGHPHTLHSPIAPVMNTNTAECMPLWLEEPWPVKPRHQEQLGGASEPPASTLPTSAATVNCRLSCMTCRCVMRHVSVVSVCVWRGYLIFCVNVCPGFNDVGEFCVYECVYAMVSLLIIAHHWQQAHWHTQAKHKLKDSPQKLIVGHQARQFHHLHSNKHTRTHRLTAYNLEFTGQSF